ncbi:MAG: DNA translocase FtsK [Chloroflexota bacterium]
MTGKRKENLGFKSSLAIFFIAIGIAAIFWFLPTTANGVAELVRQGRDTLGLGLILILLFHLLLLWIAKTRPSLLWQWRHRWLGIGVLLLTSLGLLAYFQPASGGTVGQWLLGTSQGLGLVRVVLLAYLGLLFLAPRLTLRLTLALVRGLRFSFRAIRHVLSYTVVAIQRFIATIQGWRQRQVKPDSQSSPSGDESASETPVMKEKEKKTVPAPHRRLRIWPRKASTSPPATNPGAVPARAPVITASGWELPPMKTLEPAPKGDWGQLDTDNKARRLEEALASYGVEAKVTQINVGPAVTQFGVEPGWERKFRAQREKDKNGNVETRQVEVSRTRVKVERIQSLSNDLALAMAAPSIRIEAPIPGKPLVGIEVPNTSSTIVSLRNVAESNAFIRLKAKNKLALALGQGAGGEAVVADLGRMPHLLMAGATGSGKSVCLNSLICCLLLYNTPDDLKLVLIDPKRVEMTAYNPLPHLMGETVVDMKKAVDVLKWLNLEMDSRYRQLAAVGVRNIEDYNKNRHPTLPYYVLVIDELADLMMTASEDVEHHLCRLAQLARATGIHLIVATQRPSVDVVTGLIKANFPTRMSFAVTSQVDSRTILDSGGAEKLLGRGDMLFQPTDAPKPKRLQGCFISDAEIDKLVSFWARQKRTALAPQWETPQPSAVSEDPTLEAARHLAREHKQLSASFLQRRLQIGQARAIKIIETLEQEGLLQKEKE